jgi:hypothetical protein
MKSKILIFTVFLLAISGGYYLYETIYDNEIVVISPIKYPYKRPALQQESLFAKDSEKLIYQNFDHSISKKNVEVKMLPEPEAPIILKKPKPLEDGQDIKKESSDEEAIKGSIWEVADSEIENKDKLEKTLKITNIKDVQKKEGKKTSIKKSVQYFSQLGYFRSEKSAKEEWAKIKNRNKKHMAKLYPTINKLKKRNDGYHFELLAGPYNEFKSAKYLCKKISLKTQNCIVVKK